MVGGVVRTARTGTRDSDRRCVVAPVNKSLEVVVFVENTLWKFTEVGIPF